MSLPQIPQGIGVGRPSIGSGLALEFAIRRLSFSRVSLENVPSAFRTRTPKCGWMTLIFGRLLLNLQLGCNYTAAFFAMPSLVAVTIGIPVLLTFLIALIILVLVFLLTPIITPFGIPTVFVFAERDGARPLLIGLLRRNVL